MKKQSLKYDHNIEVPENSCTILKETNLEGEIITDLRDNKWKIGPLIAVGGFGKIYLASDDLTKLVRNNNAKFVVKVEPFNNGPLFVEAHVYLNIGKKEKIDEWAKEKKKEFLGMPNYLGCGSHSYMNEKLRFIVLPRFGMDLQTSLSYNKGVFDVKTAFTIAIYVVDALEYIHEHGYVHADIKSSNLVFDIGNSLPIYLLDYGLSCKIYNDRGQHKKLEMDQRKAHDGTLEYTSRDAHLGAHSRRGDLESLGYNLIKWVTGRLPWEIYLPDAENVERCKRKMMNDVSAFLNECFGDIDVPLPRALENYISYINGLKFKGKPDYEQCRALFKEAIKETGSKYDGKLTLNLKKCYKNCRRNSDRENYNCRFDCDNEVQRLAVRKPCGERNLNARQTRQSIPKSEPFDWPKILRGHPEKQSTPIIPSTYNIANVIYTPEEDFRDISFESVVVNERDLRGLDNPTPAMLAIMERNRNVENANVCNGSDTDGGEKRKTRSRTNTDKGVTGSLKEGTKNHSSRKRTLPKTEEVKSKRYKMRERRETEKSKRTGNEISETSEVGLGRTKRTSKKVDSKKRATSERKITKKLVIRKNKTKVNNNQYNMTTETNKKKRSTLQSKIKDEINNNLRKLRPRKNNK